MLAPLQANERMVNQALPRAYELPAMETLLAAVRKAFAEHVEVDWRGKGAAVVRLAGLELTVVSGGPAPKELLPALCERLAEVAAFGIATALTTETVEGTHRRMELISALAIIEASPFAAASRGGLQRAPDGDELLTTVEVAAQLGMSRPYVSMLCDQGKLGEVTRSEGGHRRIRQSAVNAYKHTHAAHAAVEQVAAACSTPAPEQQRASSPPNQKTPARTNKST